MDKNDKEKKENMITESMLGMTSDSDENAHTEDAKSTKWTPEQLDAIERRGENLLVAAAAGSGKTSVMVERIRRMVCDEDVPVENLLVVTFTNAAAAEMKERIRTSLADALEAEDAGTKRSKQLREQIRNIPLAQISTFHAFGMSVIKRFFYLTDIDPGTRVGEETEFAILKDEAMDALLEEEFERSDADFIEFMDNYSGDRGDYHVRELILKASGRIGAMPHGMEWAYNCISEMEHVRDDFAATAFWKILKRDIDEGLTDAIRLTGDAARLLDDVGLEEKSAQLRNEEIARYMNARTILSDAEKKPEVIMSNLRTILSERLPSLNPPKGELKEVYEDVKSSVTALRDEAKAIVKKLVASYLETDFSNMLLEIELDAASLRTLLRLTERFNMLYSELKKNQGVMDFDDIEHYAFDILEHEEACEYYRNKYRYIFVDEYQDTNLMQEAIISKIKGDDNLFMVGDIKQSIYKFRLAEPSIFQGKYERFKAGEEAKSSVIDLNRNHRSKAPILEFINGIFRNIMNGYDKDAELYPGIEYDGELLREPEIHVLMMDENAEQDGNPETWDKVYLEAKHVARIIKDNLGKPFMDSKARPEPKERPLEKRDIVVLMRSVSNYATLYNQALMEEGIDAYLEGDDGYFDTLEISAFINLLAIIDSIMQDVPLLSVLHSGIFGFTSKELAEIRVLARKGSFAEAFLTLAAESGDALDDAGTNHTEKGDGNTSTADVSECGVVSQEEREKLIAKCQTVLKRIRYWQDLALTMPLDRYVWKLMIDSNCYITMGALPRGGARQANLRALCDMAEKYTRDRQATLYGFLNYVSAVKSGRVKIPEVSKLGEGDDVVRIMTIHKSKGLEFPMVVVSGLGGSKRYGESGVFNMHKDIGLALTLKNGKEHWEKKILIQSMINSITRKEEVDEEIRVLYVALTRARDILYLVGYETKDISEFTENGIMSTSQYMKMILTGQKYRTYYVGGADTDWSIGGDNTHIAIGRDDEWAVTELTEEKKASILNQLNYEYPYEAERHLKSKYSVSELNKRNREAANSVAGDSNQYQRTGATAPLSSKKKIVFVANGGEDEGGILADINKRQDESFNASEIGTIYHAVLERLDFRRIAGGADVVVEIETLMARGFFAEEEIAAIDIGKIKEFFDSDIGRRVLAAAEEGRLDKERPFTLVMDMDGKEVLVQGVIDCYFREYDAADRGKPDAVDSTITSGSAETDVRARTVLIDYKSNRVYGDRPIDEEIERISSLYRGQLEIYKSALVEAGLGPVDEVYLYLLDIGKTIAID